MSLDVEREVPKASAALPVRTDVRRKRSRGRYPDLQREALRRRRRSHFLMATSLGVLGGLLALFYAVLT
jgi:hypothetical protein